jgi:hypothetical protein
MENQAEHTPAPGEGAPAPGEAGRAKRKAARRAAFIQEVAEAVAGKVWGTGPERGPFARACHEEEMAYWRASKVQEEESDGLHWALRQGLLPAGTKELPSDETQQELLASLPLES